MAEKYTGQLNYFRGMSDDEINKCVREYSSGYKPKPTGQTKTQKLVHSAFSEVYGNTPKAVQKTLYKSGPAMAQKQRVAIALSKARSAGARIPKK